MTRSVLISLTVNPRPTRTRALNRKALGRVSAAVQSLFLVCEFYTDSGPHSHNKVVRGSTRLQILANACITPQAKDRLPRLGTGIGQVYSLAAYLGPPIISGGSLCIAAVHRGLMRESFQKVGDFYVDHAGNTYFCVDEFVRANQLPDSPALRVALIEIAHETFPGIRVLEEWN
jgi:hypothetical protein